MYNNQENKHNGIDTQVSWPGRGKRITPLKGILLDLYNVLQTCCSKGLFKASKATAVKQCASLHTLQYRKKQQANKPDCIGFRSRTESRYIVQPTYSRLFGEQANAWLNNFYNTRKEALS